MSQQATGSTGNRLERTEKERTMIVHLICCGGAFVLALLLLKRLTDRPL